MVDIIKMFGKWLLAILIILLIGGLILAFRIFVIDRNFDGKSESARRKAESASTDTIVYGDSSSGGSGSSSGSGSSGSSDGKNSTFVGKVVNGAKTIGNATVSGYKEDEENYKSYNFDEAFLMYEGENYEGSVKAVLQRLLDNSNGEFYARTAVTAVNFGNNVSIEYNGNLEEYQNAINSLKNSVEDGDYEISFKYGALRSYVNEIVITKK